MAKELRKILFVDDDEDIHVIVNFSLRELKGVEVRFAFSGEDAVKMALDFAPDLILLDVMMPGMDGIATLDIIRTMPKLSKTPVVFLTAKAQNTEIEDYFKHGIADVIVKPFDPNALPAQILRIWERLPKE